MTYSPVELLRMRRTASFALPDPIFRVVLEFLSRNDLAVVALVSRRFCASARYALYHALDVQTITESSLERLYNVLARTQELAALVVSFYCHSWPLSWEPTSPDDGRVSSIPIDDVRQALQNMYNLKSLTLASFATMLSHTPSLTFSLTRLTILDKKITQSQLVAMRSWLATQPSLESLSFPHLVECTTTDPSFIDEWASVADPSQTDGDGSFSTILPGLKSLRASTEIVSTLCLAMHNPIEHLRLDVHETLYTGLRPSTVLRSLGGVRDMHIIFGPEVDKRTVEKFLGVTGSMLTGEDKAAAMKSLEVEVSWTDDDAAEVCPRRPLPISSLIPLLHTDALRNCHCDHIAFPGAGDAQIDVPVSLDPCADPRPRHLVTGPAAQPSLTSSDGIIVRVPDRIRCYAPWQLGPKRIRRVRYREELCQDMDEALSVPLRHPVRLFMFDDGRGRGTVRGVV